MEFPEYVRAILARLWERGYTAYAVGGCVRDTLLGRAPHDWDIASAAPAAYTAQLFSAPPFSVRVGTGLRHGTVTVCLGGAECEVTTFRQDGAYTDHRRPDAVTFVSCAEDDLARRDFTVNALAIGANGRLIDRFGGSRGGCDPLRRARRGALYGGRAAHSARDPLRFALRLHDRGGDGACDA